MKKGFFFSVVSLILLIYLFSSISYKIDYVQKQSKTYEEALKLSSYEFIFAQLSKNNMQKYIEVSLRYAILKLAEHSASYPIKPAGSDSLDNVRSAVSDLFQQGYAQPSYFSSKYNSPAAGIQYTPEEIEKATVEGLRAQLEKSLKRNGLALESLDITLDGLEMSDSFTIKATGKIEMNISDAFGTSKKEINGYNYEVFIPIESFPDPLVSRYLENSGFERVGRYIYKDLDGDISLPKRVGEGYDGQGWFYGKIVEVANADSIDRTKRHLYILAGKESQIQSYSSSDNFGAYLFNDVVTSSYSKPFILIPGFNLHSWRGDSVEAPEGEKTMLFISESETAPSTIIEIYGMEEFRDDVLCGYYYSTSSNSVRNDGKDGAPSFLQRLLEDGYNRADDRNGIFSFLVGREYGGDLAPSYARYSKLDFEFVRQWDLGVVPSDGAIPIRGMPACKNKDICSKDVDETYLSKFSISAENIRRLDSGVGYLDEVGCPGYSSFVGWGVRCE